MNHDGLVFCNFSLLKGSWNTFGFLQSILKAFKNSWTESSLLRSQFVQFAMVKQGCILQRAGKNMPGLTAQSLAAAEAAELLTSWCSFCPFVVICSEEVRFDSYIFPSLAVFCLCKTFVNIPGNASIGHYYINSLF